MNALNFPGPGDAYDHEYDRREALEARDTALLAEFKVAEMARIRGDIEEVSEAIGRATIYSPRYPGSNGIHGKRIAELMQSGADDMELVRLLRAGYEAAVDDMADAAADERLSKWAKGVRQ